MPSVSGPSKKGPKEGYANDPRLQLLKDKKPGAGAKAWGMLHLMALDGNLNRQTLRGFMQRISCPNCQRSFQNIVSENPPDFSDVTHAFEWTVRVHNMVNKKTNKPTMTLAKAFNRWACLDDSGTGTCEINPQGGSCMCG